MEVNEMAVEQGIILTDGKTLIQRLCTSCGERHPARCRVDATPSKTRVANEITILEREQFRHSDDEAERRRILEIRELAQQQLSEDVYHTAGKHRDRVGRQYVENKQEWEDGNDMWPERSEVQRALQRGLDPVLDQLTANQRVLFRLHYGAGMTEREVAKQLNKSQQYIHGQLKEMRAHVRASLVDMVGGEEDE